MKSTELRITLLYAGFSSLWVLLTNGLHNLAFLGRLSLQAFLDSAAGWGMVLVTSVLFYMILRRLFRGWRATEEALRASEERYRIVSDLISDYAYSFRISPEGAFESDWITDSFYRTTGYTAEELDTKSDVALYHPDDAERVRDDLRRVLRGEKSNGEYRIITKAGDVRWLYIFRRPVWDAEQQRVTQFYGVAQDITARKAAEQALAESLWFIERAQEVAHVGSWKSASDRDDNLVWSKEVYRIFGVDEAAFDGKVQTFFDHVHPDDLDAVQNASAAAFAMGEVYHADHRLVRPNGEIRWVSEHADIIPDAVGKPMMIGIVQDITERKIAETALEEERRLLRALIDTLPDSVFVKDIESRFVVVNAATAARLGAESVDQLLGKSDFDFLPEEVARQFRQQEIQVMRTGQAIVNREELTQDVAGNPAWVLFSKAPFRNSRGEIVGLVGITRDITELKRMEADALEKKELRLALDKESQLQRMRSRFMTMVSHEFRTPLATMLIAADLVDRYYDRLSHEARQEHLAKIRSEGQILTEMLDDILVIMKTETVGPDFRPARIDVVALCRKLVREAELQGSHTFAFDAPTDPVLTFADEKLLRHAVGNLLSNAVKYSPAGTTIRVELRLSNVRLHLRVRDQGIGIPKENIPALFQAFYRADNVGEIPGTGLGLIITKQAVELHGGTIEVESAVGAGTSFTISLPLESIPELEKASREG